MSATGYIRQAEQFLKAAHLSVEQELWSPAASAAIHAAINANDAVCLALAGERARTKDHARAAQQLSTACRGTPWERDAKQRSKQFRDIVAQKDVAEYAATFMSADRARRVVQQADRFVAWARSVLEAA